MSSDLIRGLPAHLSDGGEFYSYLLLTDRSDGPAEVRVREMLGADGKELDVALLIFHEELPSSFLLTRTGPDPFSKENEQLKEECRKLGINKFLKTVLTIRSRRGSVPATLRHQAVSWETVRAIANPMALD